MERNINYAVKPRRQIKANKKITDKKIMVRTYGKTRRLTKPKKTGGNRKNQNHLKGHEQELNDYHKLKGHEQELNDYHKFKYQKNTNIPDYHDDEFRG